MSDVARWPCGCEREVDATYWEHTASGRCARYTVVSLDGKTPESRRAIERMCGLPEGDLEPDQVPRHMQNFNRWVEESDNPLAKMLRRRRAERADLADPAPSLIATVKP